MHSATHERGSALVGALFLIIVVAALGAFAVRLQANQQQTATLQLLEYRAHAAAHAGLEYWTRIAATSGPLNCPTAASPRTLSLQSYVGLSGFNVNVWCQRISDPNGNFVYEVSAEGRSNAAYGAPDFVRKLLHRRVAVPTAVTTITTPGVYQ